MNEVELWERFQAHYFFDPLTGFGLDISRMRFSPDELSDERMAPAFDAMKRLVKGEIANPDENRMVGHYWLRSPELAPTPELRSLIESTILNIKGFAQRIHKGELTGSTGKRFKYVLVVGIGGSALGPQFVNQALGGGRDPLELFFFDNTDPDGMAKVLDTIPSFEEALCLVISKSGGTKETRNGQIVAKEAWKRAVPGFEKHFVAVTGEGSELDTTAVREKWLARFPMWDWVGGRTSELSAVGLLPAALQGVDIDEFLKGAREMDRLTSSSSVRSNPAALLALMWFAAGKGKGAKDMVVLPYKDRLELFSRYLQQLVMESLGKEKDLNGRVVNQGIAVYGNKGSTDQHAYVQQLREGLNNFFVVFIEVLKDASPYSRTIETTTLEVEPGITSGDYLQGFFLGTRQALFEKERESITITLQQVNAYGVGMLIALFERAVGFYATLINVNAYHQPGVEAGKKAAAAVLTLQQKVISVLKDGEPHTVTQIAQKIQAPQSVETVFKVVQHLAANGRLIVRPGRSVFEDAYVIN